jgi:hypothetical protein
MVILTYELPFISKTCMTCQANVSKKNVNVETCASVVTVSRRNQSTVFNRMYLPAATCSSMNKIVHLFLTHGNLKFVNRRKFKQLISNNFILSSTFPFLSRCHPGWQHHPLPSPLPCPRRTESIASEENFIISYWKI